MVQNIKTILGCLAAYFVRNAANLCASGQRARARGVEIIFWRSADELPVPVLRPARPCVDMASPPLVTAQTVASERGLGGRISRWKHMAQS
jgi:hypothetical protein